MVGLLFRAKRATKSAEWFQSYRRFRGADLRGTLQKTTSFSKSSSHGAAHPSRACRNMRFSTQTFVANLLPYIYLAPSVQKMRPIEDWMPPSAAGKDAAVGGLRATYAHATAHLRCSLPHHISNKRLRLIDCAPIFAHSRVLGARLDQSASGQRRMHADYTGTLGWNTCTSPAEGYVPRFAGVRLVRRPAKRSWRLQPANRRVWALRGRRAHATAPTAGRRGAPSRA